MRIMKMRYSVALSVVIMIVSTTLPNISVAQEKAKERTAAQATRFDAEVVFEQLKKGLVGKWSGTVASSTRPVEATFYMTGKDSALVEDIRLMDTGTRMHTVYHLAGDDLRLTHFCSFQNQPRLRATSLGPDGKTIEFEFVDVTNLSRSGNRYTYKMVVSLIDDQHASVSYFGLIEGVDAGSLTVELTRVQ